LLPRLPKSTVETNQNTSFFAEKKVSVVNKTKNERVIKCLPNKSNVGVLLSAVKFILKSQELNTPSTYSSRLVRDRK